MAVKVLVVDDSALMRKLFTQVFTARGYQVDSARDGEEALTKSAAFKPDVITLDINMPVMDGLTCLSLLRKFHQCPVLMLSSLTQKGALVTLEALALGAADFVLKPGGTVSADISDIEDELISKIEALTASVRRTAAPSKPVHTQQQTAAVKATAAPVKNGKVQVVMIGVSTGGPRKLEQILFQLPASFPCPVVVAQHMPKAFTAALAKRLNDLCPLEVVEVSSRMPLETGKVYIAKGDADLSFVKNQNTVFVRPIPASPNFLWHPSVDRMVESALGCFDAKNMLCVQLTGMGCDGVAAMSKAYSRGAVTIAESEATATVFGMPKELIQAGCASHVLDSHAIAQRINHLCKQ